MNKELIDALQLVPNPFRENDTMLFVADLFNMLMDQDINAVYADLTAIQAAYYDATYKMLDYSKISFEAKKELLHEMGFDYITEFINITDTQITTLLLFLNLIYILKGKKEGLCLILDTLGIVYEYTTWDEMTPKGCPFTATLLITGGDFDNYDVLKRLKNFLRSYMLPWIEVVIQLVIDAPPLYIHPSHGRLLRLYDKTVHTCSRDVDQRVAIYDLDDGNGYDNGLYGRDTTWGTDSDVPAPPPPIEYATFTINALPAVAKVEINSKERNTITVVAGTQINWRVYVEDGSYIEQSGNFTITKDTNLDVELKKIQIPKVTLTIAPVPNNAIVKMNNKITTSLTVELNTSINWEVSASGYITQNGTETMTKDTYLAVNLIKEPTALYKCYYIYFQNTHNPGTGDFSTYAYAPSDVSLNMPLYFKGQTQGNITVGFNDALATNSSELIQSPRMIASSDFSGMIFIQTAPYVSAFSEDITAARCVALLNGIGATLNYASTQVRRLPENDLYK